MLKEIRQAVDALLCKGCRPEDLIIGMSLHVACYVIAENEKLYSAFTLSGMPSIKTILTEIEGVRVLSEYPYNDSVIVYHKEACYYPELLIKINVPTRLNQR